MSKTQQRLVSYYLELGQQKTADLQWFKRESRQISRLWQFAQAEPQQTLFYIFTFFDFQNRFGLWQDAIDWVEVGLTAVEQSHNPIWGKAILHRNLGICYASLSQFQEAITHYREALTLSRQENGDWRIVFTSMVNLGNIFRRQGKMREAEQFCTNAYHLAKQANHLDNQAEALRVLGIIFDDEARFEEAFDAYQAELAIVQKEGDSVRIAECWLRLGVVEQHRGNLQQANVYFSDALKQFRLSGERRKLAGALGNLAINQTYLQNFDASQELLVEARQVWMDIGDQANLGSTYSNLGLAYAKEKKHAEALQLFEQSLEMSRLVGERRSEGIDLGNLGTTYCGLGQLQLARDYLVDALEIAQETNDRRNEARWYGSLGVTFEAASLPEHAMDCYQQAITISEAIGDLQTAAETAWNLVLLYREQGKESLATELSETKLLLKIKPR
ncbi:MAG: tetratricopeptide repeat protein [Chloroflexota bacterium]